MSETGNATRRAHRAVEREALAATHFLSGLKGSSLLSAWEDWAIRWRIAADLTEGLVRRSPAVAAPLNELVARRTNDAGLAYVWACGNAERHNPDGSADAGKAVAIGLPPGALSGYIEHISIKDGEVIGLGAHSGVLIDADSGELILKSVSHQRQSISPPNNMTPEKLCAVGHRYISDLWALVVG
ncbi:hypothetical protein EGY25_03860 [Brevundimonas intermedia]|uniref:Uncharacterized protein n=1 Tax=Brevundimonas intermedia TaxID=74315 RepID=A0A4Y9RZ84_9CAUL|nr:hypothetical protein [Brevundimonas intermedia]TFW14342.1 hypothetical protein EGY25_03860 [Brevundimonas intermedia]